MRHLLLALPVVLLLGTPAGAGEKREVKEKNFVWTLPSEDWSFVAPEAALKEAGYVLGAEGLGGRVKAWAMVKPAEGLTTQDLAGEVRTFVTGGLTKTHQQNVGEGRLSGLAAAMLAIQGEKGGVAYWFRGYVTRQAEALHVVLIEAYDGAEKGHGAAIDALKRGYRLIEGAGPEEAPSEATPIPTGDDAADAGEEFPPGGPKKEGRTAVFPSHNLRWTLPEGSPFAWSVVTKDEKKVGQLLIQARGEQARPKPEGGAGGEGEPTETKAEITLVIGPRQAGATPDRLVNASNVQEAFIASVFEGKIDAARTKIDPSRKVGNHTGASFSLAGGVGKVVRHFIFVTVMLRERQYEWHVVLEGGKDVISVWGKPLGALFDGIEFPNISEPVSGPLQVPGIGALPSARGHSVDKETEKPIPGGVAKKPKGVSDVPWEGGDPAQRIAWEARSADGMSYLYFDIRGWSLSDRAVAQRGLEEWVKERETEWRTGAGADAVTVTKGKEAWSDGAWGGAKGLTYRFTGAGSGDHPFVEQGWVVKGKGSVIVLRAQWGGANAEKTMDAAWKAIKKGIKLN